MALDAEEIVQLPEALGAIELGQPIAQVLNQAGQGPLMGPLKGLPRNRFLAGTPTGQWLFFHRLAQTL